jgi:hypothetical protein
MLSFFFRRNRKRKKPAARAINPTPTPRPAPNPIFAPSFFGLALGTLVGDEVGVVVATVPVDEETGPGVEVPETEEEDDDVEGSVMLK